MSKISISLTPSWRLDLKIVRQRRVKMAEPLLPKLTELRRIRSGSKVSRFFRHVFEHKRLKRLFGTNLAVAIIATSFIPQATLASSSDVEERIVSIKKIVLETQREIGFPLEKVSITQGYSFFHPGVDFDGITGDEVMPMMKGVVSEVQYSRFSYGNAVIVDHGNETTSLYAHLSKISVQVGDSVDTFTKLGEMGATGRAFGDHLHFEVRDHGRAINPMLLLPKY